MLVEGMPGAPGRYSVGDASRWRAENINVKTTDDDSRAELEKAKLRIDIQRAQLKLELEAGRLVDRQAFEAKVLQMFHRVRSRLQAAPAEVGSSIPSECRAEVIADLQHKISLILTEMEHWGTDD
jgi:hypothetical protein